MTSLVEQNLPLVKCISGYWAKRVPYRISAEDLYQEGAVGLIKASKTYDPARGIAFGAYARGRINGSILDYLRRTDWATREARRKHKENEDEPIIEMVEMPEHLDWPSKEDIFESCSARERTAIIENCMNVLNQSEHRVFYFKYFMDLRHSEIAEYMNLCEARISQLALAATEKVKARVKELMGGKRQQ